MNLVVKKKKNLVVISVAVGRLQVIKFRGSGAARAGPKVSVSLAWLDSLASLNKKKKKYICIKVKNFLRRPTRDGFVHEIYNLD